MASSRVTMSHIRTIPTEFYDERTFYEQVQYVFSENQRNGAFQLPENSKDCEPIIKQVFDLQVVFESHAGDSIPPWNFCDLLFKSLVYLSNKGDLQTASKFASTASLILEKSPGSYDLRLEVGIFHYRARFEHMRGRVMVASRLFAKCEDLLGRIMESPENLKPHDMHKLALVQAEYSTLMTRFDHYGSALEIALKSETSWARAVDSTIEDSSLPVLDGSADSLAEWMAAWRSRDPKNRLPAQFMVTKQRCLVYGGHERKLARETLEDLIEEKESTLQKETLGSLKSLAHAQYTLATEHLEGLTQYGRLEAIKSAYGCLLKAEAAWSQSDKIESSLGSHPFYAGCRYKAGVMALLLKDWDTAEKSRLLTNLHQELMPLEHARSTWMLSELLSKRGEDHRGEEISQLKSETGSLLEKIEQQQVNLDPHDRHHQGISFDWLQHLAKPDSDDFESLRKQDAYLSRHICAEWR